MEKREGERGLFCGVAWVHSSYVSVGRQAGARESSLCPQVRYVMSLSLFYRTCHIILGICFAFDFFFNNGIKL